MNYNKVIIGGNICRDVVLTQNKNGTSIVHFTVAVSKKSINSKGEEFKEVSFLDCEAFSKVAEKINKFFHKGMPILVEGRLRQFSWEDKDGNKRNKVVISVEYFNFCGGKDSKDIDDEPTTKAPEPTKDAKFAEDLEEEDVPF